MYVCTYIHTRSAPAVASLCTESLVHFVSHRRHRREVANVDQRVPFACTQDSMSAESVARGGQVLPKNHDHFLSPQDETAGAHHPALDTRPLIATVTMPARANVSHIAVF